MGWMARDIPDQHGRVAVVTGGNGGLGLVTSWRLAQHGAHVVIGARNLARGERACRAIERHVPGASIEVGRLDLASLASVGSFAAEVLARHRAVDLLFNNAGVMGVPEGATEDGFETQFGTNHLGHFALTMRLLPGLLRAPAARVVTTTSLASVAMGWRHSLDNPHMRGTYAPWEAYGGSKRANLWFAIELNNRLAGTAATSHVAEPGLARTNLQSNALRSMDTPQHRFWTALVGRFGQPATRGALAQLRAGTDPGAVPGALYAPAWFIFGPPIRRAVPPFLRRPEDLARLWDLSERETGLSMPPVSRG